MEVSPHMRLSLSKVGAFEKILTRYTSYAEIAKTWLKNTWFTVSSMYIIISCSFKMSWLQSNLEILKSFSSVYLFLARFSVFAIFSIFYVFTD